MGDRFEQNPQVYGFWWGVCRFALWAIVWDRCESGGVSGIAARAALEETGPDHETRPHHPSDCWPGHQTRPDHKTKPEQQTPEQTIRADGRQDLPSNDDPKSAATFKLLVPQLVRHSPSYPPASFWVQGRR